MAPVADYSTTPSDNTSISGLTVSDATVADTLDNIIRQMMADIRLADNANLKTAAVSAFIQTLLNDATDVEARATLGVTAANLGITTQTSPIRIRIGGLQVLAGTTVTGGSGVSTITFADAFSAPPIFIAMPAATNAVDVTFQSLFASSVGVQTWNSADGAIAGSITVHWLAIGTF